MSHIKQLSIWWSGICTFSQREINYIVSRSERLVEKARLAEHLFVSRDIGATQ